MQTATQHGEAVPLSTTAAESVLAANSPPSRLYEELLVFAGRLAHHNALVERSGRGSVNAADVEAMLEAICRERYRVQ